MRRLRRDRHILTWIIALLGAAVLLITDIRMGAAQIPSRGNIQIVNLGNSALNYEIRPNNGIWTQQKIGRGGTASFDCTGCVAFEARIPTPSRPPVTRTLPLSQRFQIFWNDAEKAWDIGVAARR